MIILYAMSVCVCVSSWTEDKGVTYNEDGNENRRYRGTTKQERSDRVRWERERRWRGKKGELKLKQTDISDNNLMRFDLQPPRQRLCGYNRIISAEVLCEKRKSHNRVSK